MYATQRINGSINAITPNQKQGHLHHPHPGKNHNKRHNTFQPNLIQILQIFIERIALRQMS